MRMAPMLAAAAVALSLAPAVQAADYKIDPAHTYASFAIDHFGASVNRGRFDDVTGVISFDRQARTGKVDVQVQVASVKAGPEAFNDHLKGSDIFNVAKYPVMRFVSDKLVFDGDTLKEVQGQLTLLGQTHPVTLKAKQFNCYPNPRAKTEACGGDFEAVIDRTQWGVNFLSDMVSKSVTITATIEAFKQ